MADSKLDPNKSYGWTGKILRVNLTDKTVSVSPTDPYKAVSYTHLRAHET